MEHHISRDKVNSRQIHLAPTLARIILAVIIISVGFCVFVLGRRADFPSQIAAQCADEGGIRDEESRRTCYAHAFSAAVKKLGIAEALAILEDLYENRVLDGSDCHIQAHEIGKVAYSDFGIPQSFTMISGESACTSGYYHGIVEQHFDQSAQWEALIPAICTEEGGTTVETTYAQDQCFHGVGHVIMVFTGYDLPRSLEQCERVIASGRVSCYSGVFMENVLAGHFREGVSSPYVRERDPLYPCTELDQKYRSICLQFASDLILRYTQQDVHAAFSICDSLVSESEKYACYSGMGRILASISNYDPEKISQNCQLGDARYRGACYSMGAWQLMKQFAKTQKAEDLCRRASEGDKQLCYLQIGTMVRNMLPSNQDRQLACARVDADYRSVCREAAGLLNR